MPRMLDLFCCAGGAAMGYARAGFDLYGVDMEEQPNYPFPIHYGDALTVMRTLLDGGSIEFTRPDGTTESLSLSDFAAIHASPPCQAYSTITPDKSLHPELIVPVRELLIESGMPYIIENVAGAKAHLIEPMMLCGSSFGLLVRRHRFFESNIWLSGLTCDHKAQGSALGVYGSHPDSKEYFRPDGTRRGRKAVSVEHASEGMGIDWMTWLELAEAIPPSYTEFIGRQLMDNIGLQNDAA